MRLNPDCIRDILLVAEEKCDGENRIGIPTSAPELLEKYSEIEVRYHARQCYENGLFLNVSMYNDGDMWLKDLSLKGHELIASIRSDTIWSKVKKALPGSIAKIIEIATSVLSSTL